MYVLSIDQGTTGTTAIIFDSQGRPVDKAYVEIPQHFPQKGWVEHDPLEIWESVLSTVMELTRKYPAQISAIGITNQRETTVVWEKSTGKPVYNAIVWQCRRTAQYCETLRPHESRIRAKTGLPIDAYFSASKIRWILDNASYADKDDLICGTIDTWLVYKLTGGKSFFTDYTNASRTMLFNIKERVWDPELLTLFDIPITMMATVKASQSDFGTATAIDALQNVPILAIAGDQQSALFGQGCVNKGDIKLTYGTGCFMLLQCEDTFIASQKGLITTLAIDHLGQPSFALEGSVFSGGSTIQWLRDELGIIKDAKDSEALAQKVSNSNDVFLVPAFTGLGSPYWDMNAKATITGLTRDSNQFHIIRAALESIAFQSNDLLQTMLKESGFAIESLKVDGGASANDFLMQFQADISNIQINRANNVETTALGVALLAGLGLRIWNNSKEIAIFKEASIDFIPKMDTSSRAHLQKGWEKAIRQTLTT